MMVATTTITAADARVCCTASAMKCQRERIVVLLLDAGGVFVAACVCPIGGSTLEIPYSYASKRLTESRWCCSTCPHEGPKPRGLVVVVLRGLCCCLRCGHCPHLCALAVRWSFPDLCVLEGHLSAGWLFFVISHSF